MKIFLTGNLTFFFASLWGGGQRAKVQTNTVQKYMQQFVRIFFI